MENLRVADLELIRNDPGGWVATLIGREWPRRPFGPCTMWLTRSGSGEPIHSFVALDEEVTWFGFPHGIGDQSWNPPAWMDLAQPRVDSCECTEFFQMRIPPTIRFRADGPVGAGAFTGTLHLADGIRQRRVHGSAAVALTALLARLGWPVDAWPGVPPVPTQLLATPWLNPLSSIRQPPPRRDVPPYLPSMPTGIDLDDLD